MPHHLLIGTGCTVPSEGKPGGIIHGSDGWQFFMSYRSPDALELFGAADSPVWCGILREASINSHLDELAYKNKNSGMNLDLDDVSKKLKSSDKQMKSVVKLTLGRVQEAEEAEEAEKAEKAEKAELAAPAAAVTTSESYKIHLHLPVSVFDDDLLRSLSAIAIEYANKGVIEQFKFAQYQIFQKEIDALEKQRASQGYLSEEHAKELMALRREQHLPFVIYIPAATLANENLKKQFIEMCVALDEAIQARVAQSHTLTSSQYLGDSSSPAGGDLSSLAGGDSLTPSTDTGNDVRSPADLTAGRYITFRQETLDGKYVSTSEASSEVVRRLAAGGQQQPLFNEVLLRMARVIAEKISDNGESKGLARSTGSLRGDSSLERSSTNLWGSSTLFASTKADNFKVADGEKNTDQQENKFGIK